MQNCFDLLVADVMPIYMIMPRYSHNYALFYQLLDSNLSTMVCFLSREKPLVKPMAPGLFSIIYFQIYKPKNPKIPCCNLFRFTLVCSFIYLLYLSLLDLTLVSDREGIDNPFITLVARFLFVCVGTRDLRVASYWIDTLVLKN